MHDAKACLKLRVSRRIAIRYEGFVVQLTWVAIFIHIEIGLPQPISGLDVVGIGSQ